MRLVNARTGRPSHLPLQDRSPRESHSQNHLQQERGPLETSALMPLHADAANPEGAVAKGSACRSNRYARSPEAGSLATMRMTALMTISQATILPVA